MRFWTELDHRIVITVAITYDGFNEVLELYRKNFFETKKYYKMREWANFWDSDLNLRRIRYCNSHLEVISALVINGGRVKFFKVDFSLIFENTNLVGVLISPEVYAIFLGVLILTIRWRNQQFRDWKIFKIAR